MRKNNPYYSGRGRPSLQAVDYEYYLYLQEEKLKNLGEYLSTQKGKSEFDGIEYDVIMNQHERGKEFFISKSFDLILTPLKKT